ncbi:MAG: single-stranded DNA-binding protein [Tepidisphaeraceae bacterium]|jgi:single-strand DNA-binding protein
MANVNKVILIGNLTRDPQLKYLPSQMAVVEFGLATNHRYKTATGEERDEVCFVDCSAFGRRAEVINQYCQKGKQLYIEGRLKFDTWEDKQGGGKRSKHTVVVDNFQFLGGREGAGAGGGGAPAQEAGGEDQTRPPAARPPQRSSPPPAAPPPTQEPPLGNEQHFNDSDIPF